MRFLKIATIGLILGASTISGCTTNQHESAPTIKSIQNAQYRLGTGDKIRIVVFGHKELSGEFNIGASGNISFPLILDVKASDLTSQELEASITEKLKPEYLLNPKVSIEVLSYRDIYILGEVKTPGKYPFIPNMTVRKAVAVAGGYTYRAKENTAELTRQSQDNIITKTVDTLSMVSPGDTIVITRRWF